MRMFALFMNQRWYVHQGSNIYIYIYTYTHTGPLKLMNHKTLSLILSSALRVSPKGTHNCWFGFGLPVVYGLRRFRAPLA